jgi:NTP pyrophosphatase (non-canonical NTP hydrolase)
MDEGKNVPFCLKSAIMKPGETFMEINEYQSKAMRTLNPVLKEKDILLNSVMGLCGESGEAIDIVKKWLCQGHELDKEHLIKELGDVAWYLAEAATALGVPLEEVLQGNIDKLEKRYPNGFETSESVHRDPKDL